jgi:F420-non-reducing hydrogenase small subunit
MKISTVCLSSCCGCHMALVNLGEDLLGPLTSAELTYSPVLTDAKKIGPCDLALVEGGVRTDEDVRVLTELRQHSKMLVALGTCSSFGGIPGLGSAHATLDLVMEAYTDKYRPENTTELRSREEPIDAHVTVDYYIPGCPPPLPILGSVLTCLFKGQEPPRVDLPVCAECQRVARKEVQREIKRTLNTVPEKEECLLSHGYICLGSVSRGGCEAPCTHAGVPCLGCRGPIDRVFTESTHGILYDLVRRTSHFTGMTEKEVEEKLEDILHTFYAFTLPVKEIRKKDRERTWALIHRIEV